MEYKKQKKQILNNKDFIKDGMTTEDIKKNVNYIRNYIEKPGVASLKDRIEQLKTDCKLFVERYPMLFEMCVSNDFTYENLNYFLNMREKIVNDQISTEKASEQIGKEWFEKYVDIQNIPKK